MLQTASSRNTKGRKQKTCDSPTGDAQGERAGTSGWREEGLTNTVRSLTSEAEAVGDETNKFGHPNGG